MILQIEEKRATLFTGVSPLVLSILPKLEGRRSWLKSVGLALEPTEHNIRILESEMPDLQVKRPVDHTLEFDSNTEPAKHEYKIKVKPFPMQKRALKKMQNRRDFALFMEQGTGKTKIYIDRSGQLWSQGLVTGVLIIGKKGVHRQWTDVQIPKHYGANSSAAYWPLQSQKDYGTEPGQVGADLTELPPKLLPGNEIKFLSLNIDAMKAKAGYDMCVKFMRAHKGKCMMLIDESQDIRNTKSQRWKVANKLGQMAAYRGMMTGTPIGKDLTEPWAQFKWLDESIIGIKYITHFRNEFCIMGGFEGRQIVGSKNVEQFQKLVEPYYFRALKSELGIMPKTYEEWKFDLAPSQKKMIKDIKRDLLTQIDNGSVTAANAAVAFMKMQQISNGFIIDQDRVVHQIFKSPNENPRIEAMLQYLDTISGKVTIWARFIEDFKQISLVLGDKAVHYHGSSNKQTEAKNRFIEDESIRYFLGNPQSAGAGVDGLQAVCDRGLYYSNSDNSIDRWQSEDRIHRAGTVGWVVLTDLQAKGSPDTVIRRRHSTKRFLSQMTLGDLKEALNEIEQN